MSKAKSFLKDLFKTLTGFDTVLGLVFGTIFFWSLLNLIVTIFIHAVGGAVLGYVMLVYIVLVFGGFWFVAKRAKKLDERLTLGREA